MSCGVVVTCSSSPDVRTCGRTSSLARVVVSCSVVVTCGVVVTCSSIPDVRVVERAASHVVVYEEVGCFLLAEVFDWIGPD